jgi:TRAP-type C4-dicarboxylate transport system substrate-binding protein
MFATACLFLALAMAAGTALAEEKEPTYRWKIATLAPDGVGWARHIKGIVFPAIEEVVKGDLSIKVFWGGVMGDDADYVRKMRLGQLQGAGLSGNGVILVCPEMAVVELPFMFSNYAQVDYIKKKMQPTFDGLMRENGFFMFAWIDQDFDQIYSTDNPLATLADFSRARFINWYGPLEEDFIKRVHASAVPVRVNDVAKTMRDGLADANIAPSVWMVGAQMFQAVKYINPIPIRYSPALIAISLDAWKTLPPNYEKELLIRREAVMEKFCTEVRRDNEKSLQAMYDYGVKKVSMSEKDLEELRKQCVPSWRENADKLYPRELLDELLAYLDEYRGGGQVQAKDTFSREAAAVQSLEAKAGQVKAASPEENARRISRVQEKLQSMGYYTLKVDGVLGPRTYWGIKRYQQDRGLPVTGVIDDTLLNSLGLK